VSVTGVAAAAVPGAEASGAFMDSQSSQF